MSHIGKFPFLYLNEHRNQYFKKYNKILDPKNEEHEGYILEELYFNPLNVEIIQKQIVMDVYKKSKKKFLIPFQKRESLIIMMKYVFNEYAQHLPFKIKEQIRELNGKVIGIIVPSIMINLESYIIYLEDSTTQPKQLDLPVNVSSSGNKTLPANYSSY